MDNTLSLLRSLGFTPEFVDKIPSSWFIDFIPLYQLRPCSEADTNVSGTPCQLASAFSLLRHLASIRSSIVGLHSSHLEKIEQGARRIPCTEDIKIEANQLIAALNHKFIESTQEAAFKEHISIICDQLEAYDTENDILQRVPSEVDDNGATLDIRGELETAWFLDQSKILESKEKLLNAVCTRHQWHTSFDWPSTFRQSLLTRKT
jgi:hypothetical protein